MFPVHERREDQPGRRPARRMVRQSRLEARAAASMEASISPCSSADATAPRNAREASLSLTAVIRSSRSRTAAGTRPRE